MEGIRDTRYVVVLLPNNRPPQCIWTGRCPSRYHQSLAGRKSGERDCPSTRIAKLEPACLRASSLLECPWAMRSLLELASTTQEELLHSDTTEQESKERSDEGWRHSGLCKASRREGASVSTPVCVDQGLAIVQSLYTVLQSAALRLARHTSGCQQPPASRPNQDGQSGSTRAHSGDSAVSDVRRTMRLLSPPQSRPAVLLR
ncbi:unnamed protein product [Pleuronectes platessa]|uniref:Uncharacterized protein n=1 Tax=Pleuronectes platessa TaxID=8262 RepID=A0A9N7YM42_PLEPL|nr:unnamed protein product [Pleuronectes platessa]